MAEGSANRKKETGNSQLLTYAAIGIVCILIGFFLAGGFSPATAPVANTITATPAPSPSAAAPSPTPQAPSPEPSTAAQPSPTVEAIAPSIDDIGPSVEAAANKALGARNSTKTIALSRLTYNVGPLTNPSRTYYQGDVVTVLQDGTSYSNLNLVITVYDVLKGETNQHPVSASSVLDIAGRQVKVSGSDADFKASLSCLGGSVYVYAEETGRTFSARELFEQVVAACPA